MLKFHKISMVIFLSGLQNYVGINLTLSTPMNWCPLCRNPEFDSKSILGCGSGRTAYCAFPDIYWKTEWLSFIYSSDAFHLLNAFSPCPQVPFSRALRVLATAFNILMLFRRHSLLPSNWHMNLLLTGQTAASATQTASHFHPCTSTAAPLPQWFILRFVA